jgi:predicted Ser/Thr protein kinase
MNKDLSYDEASANLEKVLVKGRLLKADVFITRVRGRRFVVKDFGKKGFFERNLAGRMVIGREIRAYRALAGIEGIPSQFKRLSPFSIAVEYLEGRDLGGIVRGEIGPGVVRQFEDIVGGLHERGWVHLDLQRRSNILLVDGKVFVVDLASAIHTGSLPLLGRCLTRLLGFADRLSLIKMKSIYAPELITERERTWLKFRNLTMPRKW